MDRGQVSTDGLTDIERAARYFFIVRESFGSKLKTWGAKARVWNNLQPTLLAVSDRLRSVAVEHKSYSELIRQYDHPDALIYCDPPYHGTEYYYCKSYKFTLEDHLTLCDLVKSAKGKVILTYNDDEQVRGWYKDFRIVPVERQNGINTAVISKELIITNY